MKTNISALMNLIAEEEKNLNNISYVIKGLSTSTSVEELDGRVNIIEDNIEEFNLVLKEAEEGTKRLSNYKSILYRKNNTLTLSDGRTIQDAIVDNTNLRRLKGVYEQLLYSKSSKKRVTEVNNSYFECKSINFDIKEIRNKLCAIDNQIQETDFEISKLNSIEFNI